MRYFFAIVLPPVAVLLCYRPLAALLALLLCFLGWIPGVVYAFSIVGQFNGFE